MAETKSKVELRRELKATLAAMDETQRKQKSQAACSFLAASREFQSAKVVMLYLSMPTEVDTAPLALRAWQEGKTVLVPKVHWGQRHMLAVEIHSLTSGLTLTAPGIREPMAAQPMPVDFIDLVVVPGLGFTAQGGRLGRGMGFYDRFLAQEQFTGLSCGLAFEEQVRTELPLLDHDLPLSMLVTDRGIRRFAPACLERQ